MSIEQIFFNNPTQIISRDLSIKLRNNGTVTDRDVAICTFLFKHRFATLSQINGVLTTQGYEAIKPDRVRMLCQNRVINKFVFGEKDAKIDWNDVNLDVIYCLDIAGRYILEQYNMNVDVVSWATSRNMGCQELVSKVVMANEVYFKIYSVAKDRLLSFNILKEGRIGKEAILIDFDFNLKTSNGTRYYIGNFFTKNDLYELFNQKSLVLESLVVTNAWKKYSMNNDKIEPALFFIGEDDATTSAMAQKLHDCGYNFNNKDRYSTFNRILSKNLYDKDTFLKFEANELERGFKYTKIASFAPTEG